MNNKMIYKHLITYSLILSSYYSCLASWHPLETPINLQETQSLISPFTKAKPALTSLNFNGNFATLPNPSSSTYISLTNISCISLIKGAECLQQRPLYFQHKRKPIPTHILIKSTK